ncbi:MAG: DUF1800 family protein [Planctomycetota bacterium]
MAVTWNLENAAHLLRRAAFGGTPTEIQAFFSRNSSVTSAVNELLSFKPSKRKPPYTKDPSDVAPLHRWWYHEMIASKKPSDGVREKLTLFWHGHLVSGITKQRDGKALSNQNLLFRLNAKGNFKDLVRAFHSDPANLYYLDGIVNQASSDYDTSHVIKAEPNENFGREIMELFTLGVFQLASDGSFDEAHPNYTEADVHQLARALTGWVSIDKKGIAQWYSNLPNWDGGRCDDNGDGQPDDVTILGVTNNNFRIDPAVAGTDNDVLKLLFSRVDFEGNNAVAMHMASRFWTYYAYPSPSTGLKAILAPFAQTFASNNFEVEPMLRAMWSSDEFYSDQAKSRTVKSPVDYIVGSMKTFGIVNTDAKQVYNSPELGDAAANMGQRLFDAPNVAGWKGGLTWINSGTLLERLDFGKNLAASDGKKNSYKLDIIPNLPKSATASPTMILDAVLTFLNLNSGPKAIIASERQKLLDYLTTNGTVTTLDLSSTTTNDARVKVRGVISLALQLPEYLVF